MPEQKTISVHEETYERLIKCKREGETWDGVFNRLLADGDSDTVVARRLDSIEEQLERLPRDTAEQLHRQFA